MKFANIPVWFLLRRSQDTKVRRFLSLVLGMALLLGCWQWSAFHDVNENHNHKNNNATTSLQKNKRTENMETVIAKPEAAPTTTTPVIDENNSVNNPNQDSVSMNDKKFGNPSTETNNESNKRTKRNDTNNNINKQKKSTTTKNDNTKTKSQRPSSSSSSLPIQFVLSDEEEFQPKIIWLASFPNSGTSFTLSGVEKLSNKSIATNYGDEVTARDKYSLSIYPLRIEGPYWRGSTFSEKLGVGRDLPDQYVLTKTHCGGRCSSCGPKEYVETTASFLKKCASGHGRFPPRRQRHLVHYPPNRVHKAIQLIRNPFHNVVARFHLDRRNKASKPSKYAEWVEAHPDNAQGFDKWCQDMNTIYQEEDEQVFADDARNVLQVLRPIPCRAEFYMYMQWHNLLHESLELLKQEANRDIPLLTIYYEDYGKDLNATFASILDFVQLEAIGKFPDFTPRDDAYQEYFTKEQRKDIKAFMKHVASNTTWNQIQRYF